MNCGGPRIETYGMLNQNFNIQFGIRYNLKKQYTIIISLLVSFFCLCHQMQHYPPIRMNRIHYRKTHICRVSGSLPSAESRALGKATICRVPKNMHSANNWHSAAYLFAECQPDGTRQRHTLPSASQLTLGKERHVHRTHPQTTVTVGAAFVCRVPTKDTRQIDLC